MEECKNDDPPTPIPVEGCKEMQRIMITGMKMTIMLCLLFSLISFLRHPDLTSLIGYTAPTSTEYKEVEVEIVNEYYKAAYYTPIWTGRSIVMISNPAVYEITVQYEDMEYTLGGMETYDKYADKVGETAIGILRIRTYENDDIREDIVDLQ